MDIIWNLASFFNSTPITNLKEIIEKALKLLKIHPEILGLIDEDRDKLAKKKKEIRLADKKYYESKTSEFQEIDKTEEEIDRNKIKLKDGRKRMDTHLVYLFLIIRGHFGSISDQKAYERIRDSKTIDIVLQNWNIKMPGTTTILENINAVTNDTREYIMDKMLEMIAEEDLDDFKECQIDSTSIAGNTEWPTDSGVLLGLLKRAYQNSQKLILFNLENFQIWWSKTWINKISDLVKKINMIAGKPKSKGKVKKYYRQILRTSKKMHNHLINESERIEKQVKTIDIEPSRKLKLKNIWKRINDDLIDIAKVIYYTENRIVNGVVIKASKRILSISDRTAAYIRKGNRDDVIGYKPQIAKSGKGFITALIVPIGNAGDSGQLVEVAIEVIKKTKTVPDKLGVDDGYASIEGKKNIEKLEVRIISIGGSKGKKITSESDWDSIEYKKARADRSGIESVIYVLKYMYQFGLLRRRGIEAVKAELLEKVIAYNFKKMIMVEKEEIKKKKKLCG